MSDHINGHLLGASHATLLSLVLLSAPSYVSRLPNLSLYLFNPPNLFSQTPSILLSRHVQITTIIGDSTPIPFLPLLSDGFEALDTREAGGEVWLAEGAGGELRLLHKNGKDDPRKQPEVDVMSMSFSDEVFGGIDLMRCE